MKTSNLEYLFILPIILLNSAISCTYYQIEDPFSLERETEISSNCDPDTVYFRNSILPLVVSSCATTGCHDQASHKDGIILTDYSSILNTGEIKAGDPGDSEFFESLTDDILSVKGFWKNKITRILLVVVFTNIGSAVGTFVAIPMMVRALQ